MKRLLTFIGLLLMCWSVSAQQQQQQDTTGSARQDQYSDQDDMQSNNDQQESGQQTARDAYANEGMVIIEKEEIPESLKETLKDEKYAGWENGTIYHNTTTGEYVIAPRTYRFDRNGMEIQGESSPGYDESSQSPHEQARDQMGEIPTSAPDNDAQSDNNASYNTEEEKSDEDGSDRAESTQSQSHHSQSSSSNASDQ